MKKLFAIFAAALIAFGMSSCKKTNGNEPEPEKEPATIEIQIDGVAADKVYYNIIPSDLETRIFFNVVVQAVADGREDADLIAEAKEMSDAELSGHVWTGEIRNAVIVNLVPNVDYVMYAFYFDKNKNVPAGTKVVRANFKTAAE